MWAPMENGGRQCGGVQTRATVGYVVADAPAVPVGPILKSPPPPVRWEPPPVPVHARRRQAARRRHALAAQGEG